MRLSNLRQAREQRGWSQEEAAQKLGVSQPYLSMLERGRRSLSPTLVRKAMRAYDLPPTFLPPSDLPEKEGLPDEQALGEDLGRLGYPGFAYLRTHRRMKNPAEVFVAALAKDNLDARLAEALPWLLLHYAEHMNEDWLLRQARLHNLQNRMGFVVNLARQAARSSSRLPHQLDKLARLEEKLKQSRLAGEDTLCQSSLPRAKRNWLMENRPAEAAYWNLLTDWRPEHLRYVEG